MEDKELRSYETKGYYISPPEIKARNAYQVGARLYKTKEAASKKIAWNWILLKYKEIQSVKKVLALECECADKDDWSEYGVQYKHECCEIHARKTGYFARLHTKISKLLLKHWSAL